MFEIGSDTVCSVDEEPVSNLCGNITDRHREKLIVALDFQTYDEARDMVSELEGTVDFYKIGLELLFGDGLKLAKELVGEGKNVFLDMKLLDIPNTVKKSVENISKLGFDFLTVHGTDRKTMAAAIEGRGHNSKLKLLAVTVLTSADQYDLEDWGTSLTPADLVLRRARYACESGFDGVIASGHEASAIRDATRDLNPGFIIKVPGIRFGDEGEDDQSRVMTPRRALQAGASYLVVGRPITQASKPKLAAEKFLSEIQRTLS